MQPSVCWIDTSLGSLALWVCIGGPVHFQLQHQPSGLAKLDDRGLVRGPTVHTLTWFVTSVVQDLGSLAWVTRVWATHFA